MNTQIELVKKPEIRHELKKAGSQVTARIAELDIENQIATEETVKGLKKLRADLNQELADYEAARKFIKNGVLAPYQEFEELYKIEISEKYTGAISMLKDKIASVETRIKDDKTSILKTYFEELSLAENIDFLKWENLNIDVNLSTSEKKYKEQINAFVSKTQEDIALIKTTNFEAEIMAEYKKTLNVSKAITEVNNRKEQEKIEAERIRQAIINSRILMLKNGLKMQFIDITNSWEYDEEIYIKKADVEDLTKVEFNKKYLALELAINKKLSDIAAAKGNEQPESETVNAPKHEKPAEPIPAPKTEKKEEIVTASFEVKGTMNQLRALGAFMRENNINYTNI